MKSGLKVLAIVTLLVSMIACTSNQATKEAQRPNILFIMSDDHAYQAISAFDDRLIQTPNIDRLANEGMLFTNSCVTNGRVMQCITTITNTLDFIWLKGIMALLPKNIN